MTYAKGRPYFDADSHIMELPDFLRKFADPQLRDELPEVSYSASLVTDEEVAEIVTRGSRHSEAHIEQLIGLGDRLIEKSKEIQALGAFDGRERSIAMDLLGFEKQLVFATHSVAMPFSPTSKLDPRLRYGATRAHNRHMLAFCGDDARLMSVAIVPLDDPAKALEELQWVVDQRMAAVWVPHRAPGERSPSHLDYEPFWELLAQSGTPFVLHVGGSPLQLAKAWGNTGRTPVKDWMGGGENLRSKDAAVLHQGPETFLTIMVMDGVFERHPNLRGASVELGAGWIPSLLTRLDWVASNWGRVDTNLAAFTRTPSQQLTQQMGFTPFVFEDVGALIDQSDPDLYLFSSDYPHTEGGRDPIARFEKSLRRHGSDVHDRFYADNFLRIFPDARTPAAATA